VKKIKILIPVYNDWKSVHKLLENIDIQISNWDADVSVFIVNDASTTEKTFSKLTFKKIKIVKIINMKKNKGHARCNAAGMKFLNEKEDFDHVILMDGDGEDRPEELSLFFNKSRDNPSKVVTANRIERSEGLLFKIFYECHKILTYIFTGKLIKFGNYSCLPKEAVSKLVKESCIWSSFSGSVAKIIVNRDSIPSIRGKRYFGPSQMNFFGLLTHSLSIMGVFRVSVVIRSILFLIFYIFFIFNNISFISMIPVLAILIFVFCVIKISLRENIAELNSSLENIESIEVLSTPDGR
tara:strand:+ start:253 stop:1140 length:888 start_codon:yes stop_codon:yes gene_type:complete